MAYLLWWFCGNFTFIQDIRVSLGVVWYCTEEVCQMLKSWKGIKRRDNIMLSSVHWMHGEQHDSDILVFDDGAAVFPLFGTTKEWHQFKFL